MCKCFFLLRSFCSTRSFKWSIYLSVLLWCILFAVNYSNTFTIRWCHSKNGMTSLTNASIIDLVSFLFFCGFDSSCQVQVVTAIISQKENCWHVNSTESKEKKENGNIHVPTSAIVITCFIFRFRFIYNFKNEMKQRSNSRKKEQSHYSNYRFN